jgi:hypothetical protein
MGDTFPGLVWAIERRCPLRRGRDWQLPQVTWRRLRDLRDLNETVFEGVCVTGHLLFRGGSDPPASGFLVAEATAPFGGEERVRATCAACEANVGQGADPGVAGCHGYVRIDPDSAELDDALGRAADRLGPTGGLSPLFTATTPRWYGLWIGSPLDGERLRVLSRLLEEASVGWTGVPGGDRLVEAARRAAADGLALHARLDPPGHVDLGWYWIYPTALDAWRGSGFTTPAPGTGAGRAGTSSTPSPLPETGGPGRGSIPGAHPAEPRVPARRRSMSGVRRALPALARPPAG